jgi:hypothetical protein
MAAKRKPKPQAELTKTETEARIGQVVMAMATDSYGDTRGARTAQRKAWAQEWGVSVSTVYAYTSEAWRRLRDHPGLSAKVMEVVTEIMELGENKDRLQAAKQLSAIIGMDAPRKVEVDSSEMRTDQRRRVKAWFMNPDAELIGLLGEALKAKESKLPEVLKQLGMYRRKVVQSD